jgi:hypothetical protein
VETSPDNIKKFFLSTTENLLDREHPDILREGGLYIFKVRQHTLIKNKIKFSSYKKEIHTGAVAKSYMRKGFLIYEEMRKYLAIFEEAVSHI